MKNLGIVGGSVTGQGVVGGVVGAILESTVENCYNTGDVSDLGINVGGVVGHNSGTVTNCYYNSDAAQIVGGTPREGGAKVGIGYGTTDTTTELYTLSGLAADFFTVGGAMSVTFKPDSNGSGGVITAVFPDTEPTPDTTPRLSQLQHLHLQP